MALGLGFLLGVLWLVAMRFVSYKDPNVHYHANFALYINGQRDQFDNFTFYEEVQSCGSDEVNNPATRVHMHDRINHVVHVHDAAATWGHFFANLGYTLGNDSLKTDGGMLTDGSGGKLRFILNGQESGNITNTTIRSEDALLIDFGNDDDAALQSRYNQITRDAAEYNKRNDPSSCTGTKPVTFMERLKQAF